jgi:hypothetical protein
MELRYWKLTSRSNYSQRVKSFSEEFFIRMGDDGMQPSLYLLASHQQPERTEEQ